MRVNYFRSLWTALLVLATTAVVHAAIPPAEKLLPADTLVLLDVPDCAALRAASHQSPQWLFWKDPAMKPFRDKFIGKWNAEVIAPLERDLGMKIGNFADLAQGQFAIAITQNGWNGNNDANPGFVLLLDARNKSSLLSTNLDNLRKKWRATGKPLQTESLHGISFSVATLSSNNVPGVLAKFFPTPQPVQELGKPTPPPPPPAKFYFGQYESLLIAGSSRTAVETVAARLTGGSNPTLNNTPVFAAEGIAHFRNPPLYYGWFNTRSFFGVLAHLPQQEPNPEAPSPYPIMPWQKILTASGLTGLKSISFTCHQSPAGAFADFYISAPESSRQGLIKMLGANPKNANPPPFVPADVMKFWRWRMDGQQAWAALQKMIGDISPMALTSLNSFLDIANASARQQNPDFDIRKNLIANLGDDWISYQKKPAGTSLADLNQPPSIFLFAATRPDEAALAVKQLLGLSVSQENAPKTREFLGRKIYAVALRPRRILGNGTDPATTVARTLYCTASGGYVAVSSDVSIIEDYLRSSDNHVKPLRQKEGLSDAIQQVGGASNGLFGYENQREMMRVFFAALKDNPDTALGGNNALLTHFWGGNLGDWFDFSLLPDYDQVAKYFYFTVYSGSSDVDGMTFKFFSPRPPQLR